MMQEKTGHLALDDMRCSMCKESKKHLLISIFIKELAHSSFLVAPDTRLPQILVFKLFAVRHICHILYPTEYVLHVQGIDVKDTYSHNPFPLFSCMWTLAWWSVLLGPWYGGPHSGGGYSEDKRLIVYCLLFCLP